MSGNLDPQPAQLQWKYAVFNVQEGDGQFGFPVDNTIGGTGMCLIILLHVALHAASPCVHASCASVEQPNGWDPSWVSFFREKRLMHQVNLTGNKNLIALGKSVADNLESLFNGVEVKPSVLHGDLWSGNMASVQGTPAGVFLM